MSGDQDVNPRRRWSVAGPWLIVAGVHLLSRIAYRLAGVEFLWAHANAYHHFVDPEVLRSDLWRSLWFDHTQPPGLNLLWGAALRIGSEHPDRVLEPVFLAAGLGIALAILAVARRLGVGVRASVAIAALWTVTPTAVLMEQYFFYTPLELLGLLGVGLALHRWSRRGQIGDAVLVAGAASALALTRASFHPLWVVGVLVLVWAARPDRRRGLLAAVGVVLLLVGGWSLKNLMLFGEPSMTSWTGANLNRITTEQLDPAEREEMIAAGELSPYAAHPAFSTFGDMDLPSTNRRDPVTDAPVVDERSRRAHPSLGNTHHRDYLDVNRTRLDDALHVLTHRPGAYLRGLSRSSSLTFRSGADWFGYGPNADAIRVPIAVERLVGGGVGDPAVPGDPDLGSWELRNHEWLLMALYTGVLVAVPVRLVRRRAWRRPDAETILAVYLWGTVTFLVALGVLVEFGENNRFRSVLDAPLLLLGLWLLSRPSPRDERSAGAGDELTGMAAPRTGG